MMRKIHKHEKIKSHFKVKLLRIFLSEPDHTTTSNLSTSFSRTVKIEYRTQFLVNREQINLKCSNNQC